jgi:hypothetical protein
MRIYNYRGRLPNAKSGPMPKMAVMKISHNSDGIDENIQEHEPQIRKDFPETWLFEHFSVQDNDTEEYVKFFQKKIILC